jgi:hypothetical protein
VKQADIMCMRAKRESAAAAAALRQEAIGLYQAARARLAALAERNPEVTAYRIAMAEIDITMIEAELEQDHEAEALAAALRGYRVLRPLRDACAGSARYRYLVSMVCQALTVLDAPPEIRSEAEKLLAEMTR